MAVIGQKSESETRLNHRAMKPASPSTLAHHARMRDELNFDDTRDFDDVKRGFVGTLPDAHFLTASGAVAWTMREHAFIEGDAPDTVNPSLWRLSRLNTVHGLFKVTERIYQVRGFCLANVTFVEGNTGLIVIDPLTFVEHAQAALQLYFKHRGERPVRAIVYTHSHRDHYGGARGIVPLEQVREQGVRVIAPAGFMEEAFSETILAGVPMRRRSLYQFGTTLAAGPMGHVDSGLGKAVGRGSDGFIPPDWLIHEPVEKHVIDGVEIVFQLTPGTEAPAEMNLYYPGLRALNLAENACHSMHNLCPLRGAKTRDSLAWSRYLDEALQAFVPYVDVVFAQHHWPVWGSERIQEFVAGQRDLYRYLHDQTLRLMSHGLTPSEIGEALMLPNHLSRQWFARGYYGAVAHNVAAIYAHYMGPYDGNPANLNPLPPQAAGAKYVDYMGGAQQAIARARRDFEAGEFRWVAEVMKHVIFSDPTVTEARELSADAMEQLGYQAESATWRNAYLLAARELRSRRNVSAPSSLPIGPDMVTLLPLGKFLEYLAIRVNGEQAQDLRAGFDWTLQTGDGQFEHQRLTLSNGALSHLPGRHAGSADAAIVTSRAQLADMLSHPDGMLQALDAGKLDLRGNAALFRQFLGTLDRFDPMFNVVEP
jgi:alkyl sulfatase BDS1-like metallo-beta-lactamase superfamily hydrolase